MLTTFKRKTGRSPSIRSDWRFILARLEYIHTESNKNKKRLSIKRTIFIHGLIKGQQNTESNMDYLFIVNYIYIPQNMCISALTACM